MSQPLVTIGVGNYNNAKYVLDTLKSIEEQTYDNIELVIIDDCSTDESLGMIREWLKSYNKPFKLIAHEKNMGVCVVCNAIINNANGKYVAFLATDDAMMPDKISVQVNILEKAGSDVCAVFSDAYLMKDDGSPMYGWFIQRYYKGFEDIPTGNIYEPLLLLHLFMPSPTVLIKMEAYKKVGQFDENLAYEDYDMWLRLAREYKFIFSDYVSMRYRVRSSSLSFTMKKWYPSLIKIYAKHIDYGQLVIKRMEDIARLAYIDRDKESLELLTKYKKVSKYINAVVLLYRLKAPNIIGRNILKVLQKRFADSQGKN